MRSDAVSADDMSRKRRDDANFAASHGGKTFAQVYGTSGNANGNGNGNVAGRNAFGKCV
jgi:hypothetical protein